MKLNIRAQTAQNQHNNSPIVLVHGLFGSLDNLGVLARDLVNDHNIIQVDMRNHGLSPRDPVMNYPTMAQDLVDTLDALQIDKATFIGHSMGGKAVMALTALAPDRIDQRVAMDIAPVDYRVRRHDERHMADAVPLLALVVHVFPEGLDGDVHRRHVHGVVSRRHELGCQQIHRDFFFYAYGVDSAHIADLHSVS